MTQTRFRRRSRHALAALVLVACAAPLVAQPKAKAKAATDAKSATPMLVGAWMGTATVPLKDSSIVVPVFYTFTQTGTTIGGTAMVPGQGSGPIANVVQTGTHVAFRVTAPEGKLLEHDGAFTKDGGIEGMVSLDKLPIAKFKIAPKK